MARAAKNPWGDTPRKRDTQFAEKREAVLRSAAKLFRDRGYEGASLNDLADILNITKPTIYYYVQSKEQLLLDILKVAQDEILSFIRAADEAGGTGYEKLRRIMIDYAQIIVSDYGACLSRIWMRTIDPTSRTEVEQRIREADRMIHKILAEGAKDGSLRIGDATVTLHALFGSLNWMAYWAKPNKRLSPAKLAETQVDVLLEGVSAAGAAGRPQPVKAKAAKPAAAKPVASKPPRAKAPAAAAAKPVKAAKAPAAKAKPSKARKA